jgi:hypothetical protein
MSACGPGIIGKSRNSAWAKVMGFCIGNRRIFIAAYHFSHGGTARAFFHGVMHTAGHSEAHAKKRYAYNKENKDRTHDGKFNGRRASLIGMYFTADLLHG